MQYLLLIYGTEPSEQPAPEQLEAEMAEWFAYDEQIRKSGFYVDGNALERANTATTLRVRDGDRVVTDGPFAETREVLGGYYLVDVPDLDTALDWAAKCPGARFGSMEVRPITVFDQG
ncbi:YciI family protein [Jiangella asiatica]|uniref:YciI family protein n=1 Tax=Jiangella asiatica TaxID=2530372 RepID=A0A4R5DLG7_9ACTN|nr:YciI family protein [Jiangella asiatica]TDE15076.1 YciI family protein [Jiangella asiatica]